jgi:hypothetical protein
MVFLGLSGVIFLQRLGDLLNDAAQIAFVIRGAPPDVRHEADRQTQGGSARYQHTCLLLHEVLLVE